MWHWSDPGLAPDVERCSAGTELNTGISDACLLPPGGAGVNMILLGTDSGSVQTWKLENDVFRYCQSLYNILISSM